MAHPLAKDRRWLPALLGGIGFVLAWVGSSPDHLLFINWDNSGYIAGYASGAEGWSTVPWNSHFGIGPVYLIGCWIARHVGGTHIQGFRLTNAVCVAGAAAMMSTATARLGRSVLVGVLVTLAFLTAWGVLVLVFTLEDNVLFLPAAVAVMGRSLERVDDWRPRDSIVAGGWCAFARLMSYQAGIYLFVPLVVIACFGGPHRRRRQRVRDALTLLAAFIGGIVMWTLFVWVTSHGHSLGSLFHLALFSRPEPSYFPHSRADAWRLLTDWQASFRHLGIGLAHEVGPLDRYKDWTRREAGATGRLFLTTIAVLCVASVKALKTRNGRPLFVAALTFFVFTVVTSLYHDLYVDKFKRYDYLPLIGAFVVAAAVGSVGRQRFHARLEWGIALALSALVVMQTTRAVAWSRQFRAQIGTWAAPDYSGRDGTSWYGYYVRIREAHPHACTYVFAMSEVQNGRYNLETPAAIWSELPDHRIVYTRIQDAAYWRHPLRFIRPRGAQRLPACAWLSPAAKEAIASGTSATR